MNPHFTPNTGQHMSYAAMFPQLVELSKAQDVEAGDGTTSVCVIAGSLLDACSKLLAKGGLSLPHVWE